MTQNNNTTDTVGGTSTDNPAATEGDSTKTKAQLKRQRQRENKKKRDKKENDGTGGGKSSVNKFKGKITTGIMAGVVINGLDTNVNILTQERLFREGLMVHADEKGMQGVTSNIKNDHIPVISDYITPRGDTRLYQITRPADLNANPPVSAVIVVTDPEAKMEADQLHLIVLKQESAKFEKVKKDMESLFGLAVGGQIHERVVSLMEQQPGWQTIEDNRDLIGMLKILRKVCSSFNTGCETCAAFDNISAVQGLMTFKQPSKTSNTDLGKIIQDLLVSIESQCGGPVLGETTLIETVAARTTVVDMAAYRVLDLSVAADVDIKEDIDNAAQDYTVAMLMLKATNHPCAEKHLRLLSIAKPNDTGKNQNFTFLPGIRRNPGSSRKLQACYAYYHCLLQAYYKVYFMQDYYKLTTNVLYRVL